MNMQKYNFYFKEAIIKLILSSLLNKDVLLSIRIKKSKKYFPFFKNVLIFVHVKSNNYELF